VSFLDWSARLFQTATSGASGVTNTPLTFTGDDFLRVLPEFIILIMATLIVIVDLIIPVKQRPNLSWLALLGYAGAFVASALLFDWNSGAATTSFAGMFARDRFTTFFEFIFLIAGFLSVLISPKYVLKGEIPIGEFLSIQAYCVLGMMVVAASGDLMAIFVGIELTSISVYMLTGFARNDRGSAEGAIKYFLLGILATAILVYGMAWTFGMTGSTNLTDIRTAIANNNLTADSGLTFAMLLLIVGFGFKIAAVPFHVWTPDAYEGAPTPVTAFMSVGPKAAGFAALIRVLVQGMPQLANQWSIVIAVLAVLTMTFGNFVAIPQRSLKRMLAYSSIAHTGYIMVGLAAAYKPGAPGGIDSEAISSILIYSLIYTFMNIGAFGILIWIQTLGGGADVEDMSGLSTWAAAPALGMAICLLSLTGIPPMAGFFGKFFVFRSAINNGFTWLAIIGVLNSAVSAFFYLRVIVAIYMNPLPERIKARVAVLTSERGKLSAPFLTAAMILVIIAIFALGIIPDYTLGLAKNGADLVITTAKQALSSH
jgi:NADH-quinone oxidoreductase subunit N